MNTSMIRKADINDLEAVAVLFDQYRQFYEQASDLELARAFIRERIGNGQSVIFVAEEEDRSLAGFCQLYPSFCSVVAAPIYVLSDLFVIPACRRGGAGRALMLAAHGFAVAIGAAKMELTTARTNARAQALYESLGWERDEVFLTYSWSPAAD